MLENHTYITVVITVDIQLAAFIIIRYKNCWLLVSVFSLNIQITQIMGIGIYILKLFFNFV